MRTNYNPNTDEPMFTFDVPTATGAEPAHETHKPSNIFGILACIGIGAGVFIKCCFTPKEFGALCLMVGPLVAAYYIGKYIRKEKKRAQ